MQKKNKIIDVSHPDLKLPVKIKLVSHTDLETILVNCVKLLKSHIDSTESKSKFSITQYQYSVVKLFVSNYQAILDSLKGNPGFFAEEQLVDILYPIVLHFYQSLSLDMLMLSIITEGIEIDYGDREMKPIEEDENYLEASSTSKKGQKVKVVLPFKDKSDIERLEKLLKDNIIGQDEAILQVVNSVKLLVTGFSKFTSFLFLGPTGVGKTQISKLIGKAYNNKFIQINCAEYSQGHEVFRLLGAPPSYIGSSDNSFLFEKAQKGNAWVFLFDEVEKANPRLWNFMLNLLDEGKVTDNHAKELDFTNSIFILTSNQGVQDLKYDKLGFGHKDRKDNNFEQMKGNLLKSLETHFPPEFLNRIDHTIIFNQLSKEDIKKIISLEAKELPIKMTDPFYDFVIDNAYDPKYNARNIKRFIKKEVMIRLAEAKLNGVRRYKGKYRYEIENNKFNVLGKGN